MGRGDELSLIDPMRAGLFSKDGLDVSPFVQYADDLCNVALNTIGEYMRSSEVPVAPHYATLPRMDGVQAAHPLTKRR